MESKRFRVAFSYAGERRPYVAEVARILAKQFSEAEIFYDRYHEVELARLELAAHLERIYRDADLVVVVLSPEYDRKLWSSVGCDVCSP